MKVGVFIPYHYRLTQYLDAVTTQFDNWDVIITRECDFEARGQVDCRNEGIRSLSSCDFVFTVDADEFITRKDQKLLVGKAFKGKHDSVFIPVIHYTKGFNHKYESTDHKPVVLADPNQISFYDTRCIRFTKGLNLDNIYLHHLGFTYKDDIMDWKSKNYWNTGNPKEVDQIIKRPVEKCRIPKEIRRVICQN